MNSLTLTLAQQTASTLSTEIDFQLAQSILDRLGYNLQDLSLDYGDVVIPSGDVSHQLWYDSIDNSCNIVGYIWVENDIYYTAPGYRNHKTAEQAALDLLDRTAVENCRLAIELERAIAIDYM